MQLGLRLGFAMQMMGGGAPSPSYDPDAQALFARMAVQPDATRKQLISDQFVAGKASTWWAKADAIHVSAAHASQAACLNWLGPAYTLLPVNNPSFVVDRGFNGDGVSSYLDTQLNPATAVGLKFMQNSGALAIKVNDLIGENANYLMGWTAGGSNGAGIQPKAVGSRNQVRINGAATLGNATTTPAEEASLFCASRVDSANQTVYLNGASNRSTAVASVAMLNATLRIGSVAASSFRANQWSFSFIGGGLTAAEVASLTAWANSYLTAVGVL